MRGWEIVIVGSLAAFVLWPSVTGQPRRPYGWLPIVAAVGALLMHIRAEGSRWQLYPIYALVVVVAIATAWEIISPSPESAEPPPSRWSRLGKAVGGVFGLALLTIPAFALPVIEVAAPPTPVGTIVVRSVSADRIEVYGPDPGGPRQIALQVWYPTVDTNGPSAPFVDAFDLFAPAAADYFGFPSFTLNHLENATMGSTVGAVVAPADSLYPIVVYSHGWTGFRTVAFNEAEALAANGYIVVAIDHTYGALGTTIDGGATFAGVDPEALPDLETVGDVAYAAASEKLVDTFRLDIAQTMDVIEALNAGSAGDGLLAGRLDLGGIGLFGHSTGGGAAIEFCAMDDRCVAVYGLDPWVEPIDEQILAAGLEVPLAALRSEAWLSEPNEVPLAALFAASTNATPLRCISGTAHRDFTLLPRLSPLSRYLGIGGSLDPLRSSELVETQLISFFDAHLKATGDGSAGLDAPEIANCGLVAAS